jgi:regulator of sigma D
MSAQQNNSTSLFRTALVPLALVGIIIGGLIAAEQFLGAESPVKPMYFLIAGWALIALVWLYLVKLIAGQIPGTALTKEDLAASIGDAIEKGFKDHVPQPEAMAKSIESATSSLGKGTADQVAKMHQEFIEGQKSLLDKWIEAQNKSAEKLDASQKALSGLSEKLPSEMKSATEKLESAVSSLREHLDGAGEKWNKQLVPALNEHAEKMAKSSDAIAGQLKTISELEKDIQKILHVQEAVDGTLKDVSSAEEFKQTLSALRVHLEESDKMLKELAKPRKIRLVEKDVSSAAPEAAAE